MDCQQSVHVENNEPYWNKLKHVTRQSHVFSYKAQTLSQVNYTDSIYWERWGFVHVITKADSNKASMDEQAGWSRRIRLLTVDKLQLDRLKLFEEKAVVLIASRDVYEVIHHLYNVIAASRLLACR